MCTEQNNKIRDSLNNFELMTETEIFEIKKAKYIVRNIINEQTKFKENSPLLNPSLYQPDIIKFS